MLISEGIYLSHQLGREVTADEVREMSRAPLITHTQRISDEFPQLSCQVASYQYGYWVLVLR